ncbi:hypothetical protein FB446DRAFT_727065 [Lentinula raphanica]|nr:hypothetical protein FB446DRAFT_727065 [Lentinula raphanica]
MTRSTPSRALALVLFGAAISSGVLAAPRPFPMNSGSLSTGNQGSQYRCSSLLDQRSLSVLQRREAEHFGLTSKIGGTEVGQAEAAEDDLTGHTDQPSNVNDHASNGHTGVSELLQEITVRIVIELHRDYAKLRSLIPEGHQAQAQARPQLFHDHRRDFEHILSDAAEAASCPALSQDVVDFALLIHRQCLKFLPEPEKTAAARKMSTSLSVRTVLLHLHQVPAPRQGH